MEKITNRVYSFQVDSDIVKDVYRSKANCLVEYDESVNRRDTCAVYFSSNDIYYPNTEEIFRKRIVDNLKSASNLNGNLNCSKELEHYAS